MEMLKYIISDPQVMTEVANKLGEISEKIGELGSEYDNLKEYYESRWGTDAKAEYYSKSAKTSDKILNLENNLNKEKEFIIQSRIDYETADSNIFEGIEGIIPKSVFSTKKMFGN